MKVKVIFDFTFRASSFKVRQGRSAAKKVTKKDSDEESEVEGQFDIDAMLQDEAIIAAVRVTRDGVGMGAGHVPPE